MKTRSRPRGHVVLVGAGPGDPGLLTVRGREALSRCDVVVYDALVHPGILEPVPPETERVFVGEPRSDGRLSQSSINEILIDRAWRGAVVVRLKCGDPFLFGRGCEEREALKNAGVESEVIPGVSAGLGAPSWAGIPLTHRDVASSVAFVTGRESDKKTPNVNWRKISQGCETLVIFMGVRTLAGIVEQLLAAGRPPETPIAILERGTQPDERVRVSSLARVRKEVAEDPIRLPALLVVGETVSKREPNSNLPQIGNPHPASEVLELT